MSFLEASALDSTNVETAFKTLLQGKCVDLHNDEFLLIPVIYLTLCILETPKRILLQTVKTQMKCSIVLHFIRVHTVCKCKKDLQTKEYNFF